jgi:hypothetical protein
VKFASACIVFRGWTRSGEPFAASTRISRPFLKPGAGDAWPGRASHIVWLPRHRVALVDPAADELLRRAIVDVAAPAASSVRSIPSKGVANDPAVFT